MPFPFISGLAAQVFQLQVVEDVIPVGLQVYLYRRKNGLLAPKAGVQPAEV